MKFRNRFSAVRMVLCRPVDDVSLDTGGGGDSTTGTVGTGNDDRLALLNQINDQNDRLNAEELADVQDDGSTSAFVAPELTDDSVVVDPADTPLVVADPTDISVVDVDPVVRPKIKVNGEEIELTDELIAKAQKIASADKYLADAKKPTPVDIEPKPTRPSQEDVDRAAQATELALVRAIQTGTEEEAVVALREMRKLAANPSGITSDDISRSVDERLSFNTALEWFNNEYKDLVDDPQMKTIVQDRDDQLVQAGDKRPYKERYAAIGTEVRAWRDSLVSKYAPKSDPVQNLAAKEAKKADAPKVPVVASSIAKPAAAEDDKDESASDVIAAMAKRRGGPQWARS